MKTAEEILQRNGIVYKYPETGYQINARILLSELKQAMEEYAAQQVAKDRAEHLLLDIKTQPTDQEIEEWAKSIEYLTDTDHQLLIAGVKAMRNGEIKKSKIK